jgi:DNA-binding transcriptional LysR family regulator
MFSTVAELGTLKSASDKLFKTQAAISQGISKLEDQLSVKLFNRELYRLQLTPEGQQLLQQTSRVLNETHQLWQMASHYAQGNETAITIAFEASFDLTKLLPALEEAQQQFPGTQFILQQEYLSGAFERLVHKDAEIALTPVLPQFGNQYLLTQAPLYQGSLVLVAAPKLLSRHGTLHHAEQLINEYQILVKDSGNVTGDTNLGVQKGQRHWHVTDFSTKKMLILSGMGWGKLPEYLVNQELESGQLIRLELTGIESTVNPVYSMVKLNSTIFGPVGKALWQAIEDICEK